MRPTRIEILTIVMAVAVFLGPLLLPRVSLPGRPEPGLAIARRLLEDLATRQDTQAYPETFVYGHTPEEPAEYSYSVSSRDLNQGLYDVDVRIQWKAIPDTKTKKGSRSMEVHLGQLVKKAPI